MYYKIVNPRGIPLSSFHSNDGWKIGNVFPCSRNNYIIFSTEEQAQEHLDYIIRSCQEQESRWGEWTNKALKFAHSLKITNKNI